MGDFSLPKATPKRTTAINLDTIIDEAPAKAPAKRAASAASAAAPEAGKSAEATSAAANFDERTIALESRVSDAVKKLLADKGIVQFTEIQKSAFEPVFSGRDILARSRTGTVTYIPSPVFTVRVGM